MVFNAPGYLYAPQSLRGELKALRICASQDFATTRLMGRIVLDDDWNSTESVEYVP